MGVGLKIKELLRDRKKTIKQLSQETGISLNTLYSITKRDSVRVDPVIIKKIAENLSISVSDLVEPILEDAAKHTVEEIEKFDQTFAREKWETAFEAGVRAGKLFGNRDFELLSEYFSMLPHPSIEEQDEAKKYMEKIFPAEMIKIIDPLSKMNRHQLSYIAYFVQYLAQKNDVNATEE